MVTIISGGVSLSTMLGKKPSNLSTTAFVAKHFQSAVNFMTIILFFLSKFLCFMTLHVHMVLLSPCIPATQEYTHLLAFSSV